jgi:hypothetical protein
LGKRHFPQPQFFVALSGPNRDVVAITIFGFFLPVASVTIQPRPMSVWVHGIGKTLWR